MADPGANTRAGELRGREREGVLLFAGIPYAAAPLGVRRFAPPEPHPGWSGVLDARRFGRAAPQRPGTGLTETALAWDEDCLTLNVQTPALDDRGRPVLVWIHGGGFRTGKGGIPWYDGTSFARRGDVVTVTLNYRLGALGFANLAHLGDELASSGVHGLLDQVLALEWVRDHIAVFGGDPEQVTVAGESAGAMSVGTLLGMPRARKLFRRAIAQSGAAHHQLSDTASREVATALLHELGAETLGELRALSADEILDAQTRAQEVLTERNGAGDLTGTGGMAFQPTVDGRELPQPPLASVRAGACRDIELLIGTNREETTLWGYGNSDAARLARIAGRIFPDRDAALKTYREAHPDASDGELTTAITTDQMFRIPAIRLAEAQIGAGGTAYQYCFSWRSRAFEGRLGATHALEIPFAFHTLTRPGVDTFLGSGPLPEALADAMHAAWTAFIRGGDPSCEALGEWPRFDPVRRASMELGDEIGVREDPDAATRRLWDDLA